MNGRLRLPDHPLDGVAVEVIRRNGTGSWTVRLLTPRGAYKRGCPVLVKAGEFEREPDLVVGQCPECWAINRHEPSCPVHPGDFRNWLD